jgi:signal transduction histidine kinase
MVYENLHSRPGLILPVLSVVSFTGSGFFFADQKYFPAILLIIAGLVIIWLMIRIYDANNEAIACFFDSLRNDDTTLNFSADNKNKSLATLYSSMNLLNEHFKEIRIKNENNESYYKTLIQNSSAGLLVLNSNDDIELINKAACNYAGISADSTNPNLIKIRYPAFYEAVCKLKPGENSTYRNLFSSNLQMLLFRATIIRRKDKELKLVSIQDIRYELESRELESYRKLINVMTHEIMNLLSPLTSVSRELYTMFRQNGVPKQLSQIDESTIKIAVNGLQLIEEQSNGLLNFVNSYRKISRIPQPEFASFNVEDWVEQLKIVYTGKMKENNIEFNVTADKSLKQIFADKKLLNQVLINLINNSYEAVMENSEGRMIGIHIFKNKESRVIIKVDNSGPPIPPGLQDKIFVPFFTTKKNGSGIGLTISQEIMKLHNGSLTAISTDKSQTCFIVEL